MTFEKNYLTLKINLIKRMKSNGLRIDLKPTTLSQRQLEISQVCFNRLEKPMSF